MIWSQRLVDRVGASRNGIDNVASSKTIKLWIADGISDESAQKRKVVSAERILPLQLPFIKSLRRAKWRAGKKDRHLLNDGLPARGCRFHIFADIYRCACRG